jgi:hypothetical protein
MTTPIPDPLTQLPTHGGRIIPAITLRHTNGLPVFGEIDYDMVEACFAANLCQLCKEPMLETVILMARPMDFIQGAVGEPGQHALCADYATRACPMLAGQLPCHRERIRSRQQCGTSGCWCEHQPPVSGDEIARAGRPPQPWFSVQLPISDYRVCSTPQGLQASSLRHLNHAEIRLVTPGQPSLYERYQMAMLGLPWAES